MILIQISENNEIVITNAVIKTAWRYSYIIKQVQLYRQKPYNLSLCHLLETIYVNHVVMINSSV